MPPPSPTPGPTQGAPPGPTPGLGLLDRLGRRLPVRLLWFSLVSLVALWAALGASAGLNLFQDAQFLMAYEEHAVRTVLDHGQLPLWDPYSCGGLYSLGNPQTRHFSPFFLLSLLMGAPRAAPFIAFICMVLGAEGFFRYARLRTPSPGLIALVAPAFVLNGFLATCYALGWVHFFGFAFLPWVLFGVHRAMRGHLHGHVIAGLTVGVTIGFGGNYATVFALMFGAIEALFALPRRGAARDPKAWGLFALRGGVLGLTLLAATAFRTLPVLTELARSPRVMAGSPAHSPGFLGEMAFTLGGTQPVGDLPGRYYVGLALLGILAAIGLFRRGMLSRGLLLLGIFLAATGYHFGTGPFVWLRELPIFDILRYPERFLFVAALFYQELVISGLFVLARLARSVPRKLAFLAVPAMVLVATTSHAFQTVGFVRMTAAIRTTPLPDETERPFALARGNRWVMGLFAYQGLGSISCGEAYPVVMSPLLRGDLPAEEYLLDADAGTASRVAWHPGRVTVDVDISRPTTLLLNQNHHPGWHADVGEVVSHERLLGVALPAGQHRVTLSFLPGTAVIGLATSVATALGLVGVLALWRRRRHRGFGEGRALLAFAAAPLLGAAIGVAAAPNEVRGPPIVFNADGSPLLVDALPDDAIRIGATFEYGVELVASRFGVPDAEGNLQGELWFRITGDVPRAIGLFVHVFDGDRRVAIGDREVLGGTWFFANAPKDRLIRHAFAMPTGPAKAPLPWRIDVGLFHVYGDQARVPVLTGPAERMGLDLRVIAFP